MHQVGAGAGNLLPRTNGLNVSMMHLRCFLAVALSDRRGDTAPKPVTMGSPLVLMRRSIKVRHRVAEMRFHELPGAPCCNSGRR